MAGYNGYSMSNNAIQAYKDGERPISKWTKTAILDAIAQAVTTGDLVLKCDIKAIKTLPINVLKDIALYKSSWHHTSSHYNKTDFYSLDLDALEVLTDEKIQTLKETSEKAKTNEIQHDQRWKCAFLVWSGTRNHPTATEYIETGIVHGNWFIREDGSKKKTTANGFRFIERLN